MTHHPIFIHNIALSFSEKVCTFASGLGFLVCNTPSYSPESNGISEAFVKTFKRDYVYLHELDDAQMVIR